MLQGFLSPKARMFPRLTPLEEFKWRKRNIADLTYVNCFDGKILIEWALLINLPHKVCRRSAFFIATGHSMDCISWWLWLQKRAQIQPNFGIICTSCQNQKLAWDRMFLLVFKVQNIGFDCFVLVRRHRRKPTVFMPPCFEVASLHWEANLGASTKQGDWPVSADKHYCKETNHQFLALKLLRTDVETSFTQQKSASMKLHSKTSVSCKQITVTCCLQSQSPTRQGGVLWQASHVPLGYKTLVPGGGSYNTPYKPSTQ